MFQLPDSDSHSASRKEISYTATAQPAVYGIMLENDRVLLRRNPQTGLWQPPGQHLQPGQLPHQAISTAFRALLMFSPQSGPLVFMEEVQAPGIDENGQHLIRLYYLLKRPPVVNAAVQENANRQDVQWVPVHDLRREKVHLGYAAILAAWRRRRWQDGP